MLFCATFRHLSVQFFGVYTPLTPPSLITQMIRDQNCLPSVHWLNPFNQNICQTEFPKFYGVGWNIIIDFFFVLRLLNNKFHTLGQSERTSPFTFGLVESTTTNINKMLLSNLLK